MRKAQIINVSSISHSPITKQFYTSAHSNCFIISFSDESEEEGAGHLLTKEEEDVKVMWSWMEVGGCPAHPEEEAKGLLAETSSSPGSPFLLPLSTSHPTLISSLTIFAFPSYWLFPFLPSGITVVTVG